MLIAHVKKNEDGSWAEPQSLESHLNNTAKSAEKFAEKFESADWAKAAAVLHDLGKSPVAWQEYLSKKSGYGKEDDFEEGVGILDHSIIGAKYAEEYCGKGIGRILAYCIAGHHAGLPDCHSDEKSGQSALLFRLKNAKTDEVDQNLKDHLPLVQPCKTPWKFEMNKSLDLSLWIRMLFSCLVDADFLDTETYMDSDKSGNRGGYLSISDILVRFNAHMFEKVKGSEQTKVNRIRNTILADCRNAAKMKPGTFSLTVPTGGGKTLSSLAFALEHAAEYGKDRVIYVIPYTSIIEQNAGVFRAAVGDDQVVEHHSNIDENKLSLKSQLAAENWDAPIIVTTSVQFFESLFAAKTSRCRKLHNIVNSVIVLDEAQLVPIEYLQPILESMKLLTLHYNISFVISTATQPAFESKEDFKGLPLGSVREIISDVPQLYRDLQRVKVEPINWDEHKSFEELAKELTAEQQVLCVVSDRKSCRDLYRIMPEGTFHLSALMCGQHRSDTIGEIKKRLLTNEPVRVISTQLVEAGVDLDFPVVYRALAGLDSIAQAAGRCNREGKLMQGKVVVFLPPKKSPPGILRKAAETTETMLKAGIDDPLNHEHFERFFSTLYWKSNSLDKNAIIDLLTPDINDCGIQFRTAASKFKIIDDTQQRTILVPYGAGEEHIRILQSKGPERWLMRKLQRYSVNVYTQDFTIMLSKGWLKEICPDVFALTSLLGYDAKSGLLVDEIPFGHDKFYQ